MQNKILRHIYKKNAILLAVSSFLLASKFLKSTSKASKKCLCKAKNGYLSMKNFIQSAKYLKIAKTFNPKKLDIIENSLA